MALTVRGIDIMGWTKDYLRDNFSQAQIEAHVEALARDFPGITHIAIAVPMNTQAEATAEAVTSFASEPSAYAKLFMDAIHNEGKSVIFRGTDCYFEGLYEFPKDGGKANGNRFITTGETVSDNFSTGVRNHGLEITSSSDSVSDNYLTSHQPSNTWTIGSGYITGPTADGWKRTCLFDANYIEDVVVTAKVYSTGSNNVQIVARATTDSNFPGYGLQMRGSNTLRIERPGLASLVEDTGQTFTNGTWYWLKLECVGTTIRGKVWEDGNSEPGFWTISTTDATYARGYCGFGGESNAVQVDDFSFTPTAVTDTWMYRAYDWVTTNIADFSSGDMVVPYPEASFHQSLTTRGNYNQFFIDLDYCLRKAGTDNSKSFQCNTYGHAFTAVLQNGYNTQFTELGIATYDHYGTATGNGNRFPNYDEQNTGAANSYTPGTSINEGATHRCSYYPEKTAYNHSIDLYITNKGTGDWTVTVHDGSNNPVQMCSQTDLTDLTNSYQATILNANITENAMNTFNIEWWNENTDVQYHFHVTTTTGDGTVSVATANDLETARQRSYKAAADARGMEIDIRNAYSKTGVPQFLQEWGDFYSTDGSRSNPTLNQTQHETYLQTFTTAWQRLVDEGILTGFNYWRALDGHESIVQLSAGSSTPSNTNLTSTSTYSRSYEGDIINDFFNANSNIRNQITAARGVIGSGRNAITSSRGVATR